MAKTTPSEKVNQILNRLLNKEKPDSFKDEEGLALSTIYQIGRDFPLWSGLPKEGGRGRPRKPQD